MPEETPRNSRRGRSSKNNSSSSSNSGRRRKSSSPTPDSSTSGAPTGIVTSAVDLSQVDHGLSFAEFDPSSQFAGDLFTDSSPIPRTPKEQADAVVEGIEEKRQTMRIVSSNLALNQDIVRAGIAQQKFLGSVIDYGTARTNNQTKFIGYQTAGVNQQIAQVKYEQAQTRLTQGQATLDGMNRLTPLVVEEWDQRLVEKQNSIADLRQKVLASGNAANRALT